MIKDFASASQEAMTFLRERFGFQLWMVTRAEADDWIVLHAEDHGYGVRAGQVFRWTDSFCSRMVRGLGPRVAPDASQVAVYQAAPIGQLVEIGAYIGIPLTRADGSLFGTLCAIDPQVQPEALTGQLPLFELLAGMLSALLATELQAAEAIRRAERAEAEATRDSLTGLYNRRGWDLLLQREEERCLRYGHPACVISIDLDELKLTNDRHGHAAGDMLLMRTGEALQQVIRATDVAARLGGDEFAVLSIECDDASHLVTRLGDKLEASGVKASIGVAARRTDLSLQQAFEQADAEMYQAKRRRKQQGA
ncbi:sensor domain-containing diguanylate cyclase [Rugamonas sp. CCM 8940]|uniref:sensor domain-containing diguanylate cyclase n=1 Tax=Rugamonas sp. CCM 8940 TaxID=2765359 RepID=UPI0018F3479F|nr:sensor domain-containing diguanylate cyclase [Rugamonas sp. CCM 8940]MBJ7312668.1 sensor domain-containing diguanylate cyclase [Rugamonas sp. CCM 8940]